MADCLQLKNHAFRFCLPEGAGASLAAELPLICLGHGFTGRGKNPVLLKGTASQAAEKILFCLRARLQPCHKCLPCNGALAPEVIFPAHRDFFLTRSYATLSTTARVFSGSGIASAGTAAGGPIFFSNPHSGVTGSATFAPFFGRRLGSASRLFGHTR